MLGWLFGGFVVAVPCGRGIEVDGFMLEAGSHGACDAYGLGPFLQSVCIIDEKKARLHLDPADSRLQLDRWASGCE